MSLKARRTCVGENLRAWVSTSVEIRVGRSLRYLGISVSRRPPGLGLYVGGSLRR